MNTRSIQLICIKSLPFPLLTEPTNHTQSDILQHVSYQANLTEVDPTSTHDRVQQKMDLHTLNSLNNVLLQFVLKTVCL